MLEECALLIAFPFSLLRARHDCGDPGCFVSVFLETLDGGSVVLDGEYVDAGDIMYGYGGQHDALDGITFGNVLTDARNEVLSGACGGWRRFTSTFSEQTDLSNPNDGGVHDGKDYLDVDAGDFGAPVAQIVDVPTRSRRRFLVPGYAFCNAQWSLSTSRWACLVPQERFRNAQWNRSSTPQCPRRPRRGRWSSGTGAVPIFCGLRTFRR